MLVEAAFERPSVENVKGQFLGLELEEVGARHLCMRHMSLGFKPTGMNTMV